MGLSKPLVVTVKDLATVFPEEGLTNLKLVSQGKKESLEGHLTDTGCRFLVPVELRDDGRPVGPFVYRNSDQRSFIYLQWWGRNAANQWVTFRRIKLYFDQISGWPEVSSVTINGTDRKGHPACSTAIVL